MKYDYEKMAQLRKQRWQLYKDMLQEKDYKKKKRLEFKVKILDIKMAIERLKM